MTVTSATSTQAVLDHHLQCFGAGDLPGVMADYAKDAVVCTPTGVLRGPDNIAPLFQGFLAEFAKPGTRVELQQQSVEGDVAYIVWTAETVDNIYALGTDTFFVRDGKIQTQTFAAKATPGRPTKAVGVIARDAVEAAPNVYKALFENDRVRLLEARIRPGESSVTHSHPNYLAYPLGDCKVTFTSASRSFDVEMKAGQAMWQEASEHSAKNSGTGDAVVLIFEVK